MIVTYKTDDNSIHEIVHVGSAPQLHFPNTAWAVVNDHSDVILGVSYYDAEYGVVVTPQNQSQNQGG